jgi:hypothetical protein
MGECISKTGLSNSPRQKLGQKRECVRQLFEKSSLCFTYDHCLEYHKRISAYDSHEGDNEK